MQIGVLIKDDRLIDSLLSTKDGGLEWHQFARSEELLQALGERVFTHVILSDRLFDYWALEEWMDIVREQHSSCQIIILLSNHHEAAINEKYKKMCAAKQAQLIYPGRGTMSIMEQIFHVIYGSEGEREDSNKSSKIVAFMGSTPNIGTTIVSFGTALSLAKQTTGRIGYLCLNLKSSKLHRYLGREDRVTTLDSLRAELKAQSLQKERLLQYCESIREARNLYVLYGNMQREQAEFFAPEEIEYLLKVAKSLFDVCVIEVNAYWDNAATICGMLHADTRIIVTTSELAHFQEDMNKWLHSLGSVFGLNPQSFDLVVTQLDRHIAADGLKVRDIRKETQMHLLAKIRKYPEIASMLNQGRIMDLLDGSHPIQEGLSPIIQSLIDVNKLTRTSSPAPRPWLKRVLRRYG